MRIGIAQQRAKESENEKQPKPPKRTPESTMHVAHRKPQNKPSSDANRQVPEWLQKRDRNEKQCGSRERQLSVRDFAESQSSETHGRLCASSSDVRFPTR
jgi:hypothetical protein